MTDYDKPSPQYIANMITEYIANKEKIDPWVYEEKGVEIEHSNWPIQVSDLVNEGTIEFNEQELCYHIDEFREVDVDGFEVRRRNATGGDYVDLSQILMIRGEIGLEVDSKTGNELIFDPENTELDYEISFRLRGGRSYQGERPPF